MRPSPALSLRIRFQTPYTRTHERFAVTSHTQQAVRAAYYRGGTARAVIIQPQYLPKDRTKWLSVFRQIMGSPDSYQRQLDSAGAGVSSLGNICLVEPYINATVGHARAGLGRLSTLHNKEVDQDTPTGAQKSSSDPPDVDFTFIGLNTENGEVDTAGAGGNMSSAVGPYAYNAGLLSPHVYKKDDGEVTVRIRNVNTGKLIDSTFDVVGGQAAVVGDYAIDGVPGTGSKIKLEFKYPYGSRTSRVLPTRSAVDDIAGYKVTCVDGANPAVFVRAEDIGVDGTILPDDLNKLPAKLALLESIRKTAAVRMGIASTSDFVPRTIPKIGLVSPSSTHAVLSGQTLETAEMDLVVRFVSDTQAHRAIPLTGALALALAARIPGTIVQQMLAPDAVMEGAITIGHASGRLQVNTIMDERNAMVPLSATVYRTAKRLFEGSVFWTDKEADGTQVDANRENSGGYALGLLFVLEGRKQAETDELLHPKVSHRSLQRESKKASVLKKRQKKEEKAKKAGGPRTTRREVGLDASGNLIQPSKKADDWWERMEEKKMDAKAGSKGRTHRWLGRGHMARGF